MHLFEDSPDLVNPAHHRWAWDHESYSDFVTSEDGLAEARAHVKYLRGCCRLRELGNGNHNITHHVNKIYRGTQTNKHKLKCRKNTK